MKPKTYRKFVDLLSCPKFKYNLIIILILFLLLYSISGSAAAEGGPNCIKCHDVANTTTSYNVSVSAMNQSDNIHALLNNNMSAIAAAAGNANNSICWGCHQSEGSKPELHPDRQTNPYKCYECHNETYAYLNVSSAPVVKEHFKSGDDIAAVTTAANATESCIDCHNQTEMKRIDYTEPDTNYTKLSLASHYGKKRDDLVAIYDTSPYSYCMYCHNTAAVAVNSTNFSVTNDSISNHGTVKCKNTYCHNSGRIHDESLEMSKTVTEACSDDCHDDETMHKSNEVTCLHCHNNNTLDYSGTKMYPGSYNAKTTIHSTNFTSSNNNTLSPLCTECHTKTTAEIQEGYEYAGVYAMMDDDSNLAPYGSNMTHKRDTITTEPGVMGNDPPDGDVTYARHANPNSSGGWPGATSSGERLQNQICINCHTDLIKEPHKTNDCSDTCHLIWDIPLPLPNAHHLTVPNCSDCHGEGAGENYHKPHYPPFGSFLAPPKSYHSVTGNIYGISGTTETLLEWMMNNSIHRNLTWTGSEPTNQTGCLVCHTNVSFKINYTESGNLIINITDRSGIHTWNSNPDCTKCHANTITANSRWASGKSKEHGRIENNTDCLSGCHAGNERPFTSIIPLALPERGHGHDVQSAGGPDCIGCHDIGKISPKVNFSIVNNSLSVHQNISTYDSITDVGGVNDTNKICWACHMDDSQYTDITKKAHADRLGDFNDVPVYTCDECHVDNIAASIMPDRVLVKEHFYGGDELKAGNSIDNLNSCEICHNLSEMKLDVILDNTPGGTDSEDQSNASYLIAHYGRKRSIIGAGNLRTGTNESVNCSYCHQNASTSFDVAMSNPVFNSSINNHSLQYSTTPDCTSVNCHNEGWMHNESLDKPDLTTNYTDGEPSSQVCLNCHGPGNYLIFTPTTGPKQRHNDTLNCTECHLYEPRDIHGVKYLQQDDTYDTSNSTAVDCVRCHNDEVDLDNISMIRPLIPTNSNLNFSHSEVPKNGSRWNKTSYWNSVEDACYYCHGDTKHITSALGPIENIRYSQELNTSIDSNDIWCGGCHYQGADNYNVTAWSPIPPTIVINNTGNSTAYDNVNVEWFNHSISSYDDMICAACHGGLLSDNPTTKELAHNAAEGSFGPDCISCHGADKMSPMINVSVLNSSSAIHSNISNYPNSNINNPYYPVVSDDNKICWACHMDNASTPEPKAHADRWIQNGVYPYNCSECHVNNVVVNLSNLIPVVEEHFYNGTDLVVNQNMTSNVSSCLACHNESEMRLTTEFDDTNSDLSLVSHYGKNRSDLRTWTADGLGIETVNCSYCHQNGSSVFRFYMRELPNSVIEEHSRYSSTPNCTNTSCHVGGWMHEATLAKPALMEDNAEDSGICLSCHDSTNYSTYMSFTSPKARHNGTLNCSECHLYEAQDIHGVKYLQQDNTYSISNNSLTVVNCARCHSNDTPLSINMSIPMVPTDENPMFSHSDASSNGSRWNETPYWNSINEACEFCHNNTKHETLAIGQITNIQGSNTRNDSLSEDSSSHWCSGCHVSNAINYAGDQLIKIPPTIVINNTGNSTSWDGTDMGWFNHSSISNFNDIGCKNCHGSLLSTTPTTTEFVHKVGEGGGKYCVNCHDISKSIRPDLRIDVQVMNKSDAIHYDLNRAAIDEMDKNESSDNVRCWACHGEGDGSDAAQPKGHPNRVINNNPRNCIDMDCHNVNQSLFNEPMVYEHFMHVDMIDENVSTNADCAVCHINSIMPNNDPNPDNSTNISMVSHYGSTDDLINTTSCIYCHLDEDNAEEWGDAPDPTSNISRLSDEDLEETLFVGDKWHLGNRYFLVFEDISINGDSAFLRLYHNDTILEEIVVSAENNFTYEDDFIDPDGDMKYDIVVTELNFTAVFRGEQIGLVKVEGRSWKRIHPEDKDPACWACHMDNYTVDKKKYLVLDEDEDRIYYLEKLVDFSDEDTEDKVTLIPTTLVIREGYNQTLDVDGNYILTANEVDINGEQAYITLVKDGSVVEDSIYAVGEIIEFEYDLSSENNNIDDFVILTAKVDSVFHGFDTDIVSLTEVRIFSDRLMEADIDDDDEDAKVGGYNTSQLHINDYFSIGGYPDTFHVPTLNEGKDGGSDCVRCHDVSNGFGISSVDAIQSRLGGHSQLNANATNKVNLADDINKACWACHGRGVDPERHPADYLYPRQCQDCHTDMEEPNYGAVDLSDENHGQVEDCNRCHAADYPGLHVINVFEPDIPYIVSINMSSDVVTFGETVTVNATAMSSWKMKVKAIEYSIDVEGPQGTGRQLKPLDRKFDEQVEMVEFTIDTTGLELGDHTIYIRAMERGNKWGPVNEAVFSIQIPPEAEDESIPITLIVVGTGASLAVLWLILRKWVFA